MENQRRYAFFVDFDDTLVETRHLVAQYFSKKYGVIILPEDILDNNGFDSALRIKGVKESSDQIYLDFGKNFFNNFKVEDFCLYDGVKEAIISLSSIYNIYIVTSRQKSERVYIENILRHNGVLQYVSEVHCVWDWDDQNKHFISDSKASFIERKREKEIGIAFVDDSIKEVLDVTKCIASPVLFDPKHKYTKENRGLLSVFSTWKQIEEIFS